MGARREIPTCSTTSPPSDASARRVLPPRWGIRVAIGPEIHPPRAGQAGGPRARDGGGVPNRGFYCGACFAFPAPSTARFCSVAGDSKVARRESCPPIPRRTGTGVGARRWKRGCEKCSDLGRSTILNLRSVSLIRVGFLIRFARRLPRPPGDSRPPFCDERGGIDGPRNWSSFRRDRRNRGPSPSEKANLPRAGVLPGCRRKLILLSQQAQGAAPAPLFRDERGGISD